MIFGISYSLVTVFVVQGFFALLYYLEWPIIERYKCLEEPWPWNDDPVAWKKLYWRSLKMYAFNLFFLTPLAYTPFYFFDLPLELDFALEGNKKSSIILKNYSLK